MYWDEQMHLPRLHSSFYYDLFIKNSELAAQQATNGVSKVSLTNKQMTQDVLGRLRHTV